MIGVTSMSFVLVGAWFASWESMTETLLIFVFEVPEVVLLEYPCL